MRKWLWLLLLAPAGCTDHVYFRSEEYSGYYLQPKAEGENHNLDRKKIMYQMTDDRLKSPARKVRVGILEKWEVTLKGSRAPREYYSILDAAGINQIGMISDEGVVYRFDRDGQRVRIGEYPILDTGLKVFFKIPVRDENEKLHHYITLEEIDPYRDF